MLLTWTTKMATCDFWHIDRHNRFGVYYIDKKYYSCSEHVSLYLQQDDQVENAKAQSWNLKMKSC